MKNYFKPLMVALIAIFGSSALHAQSIDYRFDFANMDCNKNEICYNVQAQAETSDVVLEAFNMRMYIDDAQLSFTEFRSPAANYALETGGMVSTGIAGSGNAVFGFEGEFVYLTENFKKLEGNAAAIQQAPNWTNLFQACFNVNETLDKKEGFSPSLIWDHNANGKGFARGSDGIESLAVNKNGTSFNVVEDVVSFSSNGKVNNGSKTVFIQCDGNKIERLGDAVLVYPNPTSDLAKVQFETADNMEVQVELLDINGRTLKSIVQKQIFEAGMQEAEVTVDGLQPGLYMIKITKEDEVISKSFEVIR